MVEAERMELTGPLELQLQDGSVVRIQPGPYGKGVSVVPVSLKKPSVGPGSGKRGRKPRPSTVKLRKKLDRDANRGAVKPAPEYVRWLTKEDEGISLAVARQVVYRERRAVLDRHGELGMGDRLTWSEFWPFYLEEHNVRKNRWMHFIGTSVAVAFIAAAIILQTGWYLIGALLSGYAFAWVGHFVIQKNRPATFRYPIKSFASDWRLWALMLVGRAERQFENHGIEQS